MDWHDKSKDFVSWFGINVSVSFISSVSDTITGAAASDKINSLYSNFNKTNDIVRCNYLFVYLNVELQTTWNFFSRKQMHIRFERSFWKNLLKQIYSTLHVELEGVGYISEFVFSIARIHQRGVDQLLRAYTKHSTPFPFYNLSKKITVKETITNTFNSNFQIALLKIFRSSWRKT